MSRSRYASLAVLATAALTVACARRDPRAPEPLPTAIRDAGPGRSPVHDSELHSRLPELRRLAAHVDAGGDDRRLVRSYFHLRRRAFPDVPDPIAADYLVRVKLARDLLADVEQPLRRPRWRPFGAADVAGRMTDLVQHPQNPDELWAGAASGGVWHTTDGGLAWQPQAQREASLAIGALAIDPSNPQRLYAGTGEGNFFAVNILGAGILITDDGGENWRTVTAFLEPDGTTPARFPRHFHQLAVDPADPQRVWAATDTGLFRSNADQTAWLRIGGIPAVTVTSILLPVPGDPFLHAALFDVEDGSDSGHWTLDAQDQAMHFFDFDPASQRIELVRSPSVAGRMWAAVSRLKSGGGATELAGIFSRNNANSGWTVKATSSDFPTSPCNDYCDYCLTLAAAPAPATAGEDILYLGGVSPWQSGDRGETWTGVPAMTDDSLPAPPHADIHRFLVSVGGGTHRLWAATDGGIWRFDSASPGAGWQERSGALRTAQVYHLSGDPHSRDHVLYAAQDRGLRVARRLDSSLPLNAGFDGVATDADGRTPGLYFVMERMLGLQRFEQRVPPGIPLAAGGLAAERWMWRGGIFAVDRSAPGLLVGTTRIWKALDVPPAVGQSGLSALSVEFDSGSDGGQHLVTAIAQSPVDPTTMWAGLDDGRVFFTDASAALLPLAKRWRDVTGILPKRAVSSIVPHPRNRLKAWVTFSLAVWDPAQDPVGNVWVTDAALGQWRDISGPPDRRLPPVAVNHLVALDADGRSLLLATDMGVFWSRGEGCWSEFEDGLPNVSVSWLAHDRGKGLIRAGTFGRGVWEMIDPRLPLVSSCL